jgi:hypothetical protein
MRRTDWRAEKLWSDRFVPEIKAILGQCLIHAAPPEEDAHHNTDLMVLRMADVRIACRVRRFDYFHRYRHDFTIRSDRPSGNKTELAKILDGWGDLFFYAIADQTGARLRQWTLADLNVFRASPQRFRGAERENRDRSSKFMAYRWQQFPPDFVVQPKGAFHVAPWPIVIGAKYFWQFVNERIGPEKCLGDVTEAEFVGLIQSVLLPLRMQRRNLGVPAWGAPNPFDV